MEPTYFSLSLRKFTGLLFAGLVTLVLSGVSYAESKSSTNKEAPAENKVSPQAMPFSPQDKLDAIRQGLVEASLDTPTKVQTTTWIDANGSLRESSSFKNGMKVRGVKVVSYDRDEAGQPKAQLQIVSTQQVLSEPSPQLLQGVMQKLGTLFSMGVAQLKKGWSSNSTSSAIPDEVVSNNSSQCEVSKSNSQLRHLIQFEIAMDRHVQPVFAQAFRPMMQKSWLAANSSSNSNWKMVPAMESPSMSSRMTAYENALISSASGNVPWVAKIHVRTDLLPAPGLAGHSGVMGPNMMATLSLEVNPKENVGLTYQESKVLELQVENRPWQPARLNLASEQALQHQVELWGQKLAQWLTCEEVKPLVTAINQQFISINAGSMAGIKRGDEWLIADPKNFPSQLLGKEGAPQTLLAKVQAVYPYDSKLILSAGPSNAVQVNWRAWPADTVVNPSATVADSATPSGKSVTTR